MSLMFLAQVANYLNGDQNAEWTPFYINSVIMFRGYSSIFKGTNGIGKTTLSKAILACLGWKSDFVLHTKERMSPPDSTMSHIRIEFVRPFADPEPMQAMLPMDQVGVQGEHWVFGICGHKGTGDVIRYKYKGTIADVPLGNVVDGRHILLPDEDVQKMIENADEGAYSVSEAAWRKEVAHHIRPRQLRMLEKFQRQGAGDHSTSLFDVQAKGVERYDQAFFYSQIVPELMDGLHSEKKDGNADSKEVVESFEDTVVQGSQKLIQAKIKLGETKTRIDNLKILQTGLIGLGQKAQEYSESKTNYHKKLGKVAEIGAALDVVSHRELPGIPKWVGHSDDAVEKLLRHMVIRPGVGPCLRPQGIDELLKIKKGKTATLLADTDIAYAKAIQPIKIIQGITPAKKGGPSSGSCLSLSNSLDFVDTIPASILKVQAQNELHRREELKQIIAIAFAHFGKKMDTSPHRKSMAIIEKQGNTEKARLDSRKDKFEEINKDIQLIKGMRDSMAKPRAAWEAMRESEEFYSAQLDDPRRTGECIQEKFERLDGEVSRLDRMIGGISDNEKSLLLFRDKYGNNADPLQIKTSLYETLEHATSKKSLYEGSFGYLESEKECLASKVTELTDDYNGAASTLSVISNQKEAWDRIQEVFQGLSYVTISDRLNEQELILEKALADAERDKGYLKENMKERLGLGHTIIKKCIEQSDIIQRELHTSESALQEALCALKDIEAFRAKYGEETTPEAELDLLNQRQLKTENRIVDLEASAKGFKDQLQILDSKQGAPSGVVAEALAMVQEEAEFQMLFEVIEAEPTLSIEQKKEALEQLSATLFAPVVKSKVEAQVIANTFEREKYPIPVFLLEGFQKLLRGNELTKLSDAIFAHKSKMVGIILNKDEREALKAKLEKKIVTYGKAVSVANEVALKIGPSSPLAKALIRAQAAVENDTETKASKRFSEATSEARHLIHVSEVFDNACDDWRDAPQRLNSFENDFAGLLELQIDQASYDHDVEDVSSLAIESALTNLHDDMNTASQRLQSTVKEFKGRLVDYEADIHKEARLIQEQVDAAKDKLVKFREEFRNESPFATNFARAKGFSESLYEEAKQGALTRKPSSTLIEELSKRAMMP